LWNEVSDNGESLLLFSLHKRGLPVIFHDDVDCAFFSFLFFFVLLEFDPVLDHLPVLFRDRDEFLFAHCCFLLVWLSFSFDSIRSWF